MTQHTGHALWSEAFAAHYHDLLRFLRRRTRCDETARDLLQDAWLRIAGMPGDDEAWAARAASRDHARAFLFTVADRLAIDHLRRQRLWDDELAPRLRAGPRQVPDVAESHAYAQALRSVEAALHGMPERMREVFIAHRLEGVPHEALAQRFAVSRKTIEREITRAMDLAQAALAAPDAEPAGRRGRRKAMAALLGVAGLGSAALLARQVWRERVPEWQTAFATPRGRIGRFTLPEFTALTLDADSAVEVRLFATHREVTLSRGSLFCAVAHDAARPFTVRAGDTRITVLGTRFAVEMDTTGVRVMVESGRVEVRSAGHAAPMVLQAGDAAQVAPGAAPQSAPPRAGAAVAPWRTGWLDFDQVPLATAAARLDRYRPGAAIAVDPAVAALPVLARVQLSRSTQWLQGLPNALPVDVRIAPDGSVRIGPR